MWKVREALTGWKARSAAVFSGAMVSAGAFAQSSGGTTIDVTAGVATLQSAGTAIATVGGAMLVLAGIAAAYRWARAAFF
jgi:hypothetical protein